MEKIGIPPAIVREYNSLKSNSSFKKKREEGLLLFVAMWTGYYRGEKITNKAIATKLGISEPAFYDARNRAQDSVSVDWSKYQLDDLDPTLNELKKVLATIPEEMARRSKEQEEQWEAVETGPGELEVRPRQRKSRDRKELAQDWSNMSPIQFLAHKHKDTMLDMYEVMDGIMTEKTTIRTGPEEWVEVDKKQVQSWLSVYATFTDKVRMYTKDWIELFGHLNESAVSEAILERKKVAQFTIEFFQEEDLDQLIPKYIQYLTEKGETDDSD